MHIKKFIGTKQFYKETIMIALPIMLQQFVTSFVNLIDNIMIGGVGSVALTSVTVTNRFYLLFNSTLFGIGGAAAIFISQYYGAKNKEKCQKVFNLTILISLIAAIAFTSVLVFIPTLSLKLFTNTQSIVDLGLEYINYIKYSYIPYAITFTCMMSLRSVGITKIQIVTGSISVLINVVLNYCLIFGNFGFPELGVAGAAIATSIARIVEMLIWIVIIARKKYFFVWDCKSILKVDITLLNSMSKKAIPLIINEILFSLGSTLIFKSYMRCDEYLVAAISVVDTVVNIAFIIFGGISSAVSIMIGKRLGANQLEEARDNSLKLVAFGVIVSAAMGLILFIAASYIPNIYNLDTDINRVIVILLRIKSVLLPVYVVNVCVFFILRAGGDAKSTLIMDSVFLWVVNVLVSNVLSIYFILPLITLYVIVECLDFFKLALAMYYLKKGTWVNNITIQ